MGKMAARIEREVYSAILVHIQVKGQELYSLGAFVNSFERRGFVGRVVQ